MLTARKLDDARMHGFVMQFKSVQIKSSYITIDLSIRANPQWANIFLGRVEPGQF